MSPKSRRKETFQKVSEIIKTEFNTVITLPSLAKRLNCTPQHIARSFHLEGTTVRDEVTKLRMLRAEQLLLEDTKIEAVAHLVGYKSKKNFFRNWKRAYNVTPHTWCETRVHDSVDSGRTGQSLGVTMGVRT